MKIVITLLTLCILTSCVRESSFSEQVSENQQLVEQYFQHFNNHEWEKMAKMYTETAMFKDPTLGNELVNMTRAETVAKYSQLHEVFPDIQDRIVQLYPSGKNKVIVEFVSSGTAPDNSTFELPICTIFTIENGKITKDFSYFDNFEG